MVVLNWLQNLLQKLKKDDEEEIMESTFVQEKLESIPMIKKDAMKDLEAKISYRYPKTTSRRLEAARRTSEEFFQQRRKKRMTAKNMKQEQQEPIRMQNEKQKEKIDQKPKSRGPFHPTEIPSPVFGFHRPKETKMVVEHELTGFFEEDSNVVPLKEAAARSQEEDKDAAPFQKETERVTAGTDDISVYTEKPQGQEGPILEQGTSSSNLEKQEEAQTTPPARRTSGRSHLPFNVLMLKQDRELWEAQKRKQTGETKLAAVPQFAKREPLPRAEIQEAPKETTLLRPENREKIDSQSAKLHSGKQDEVQIHVEYRFPNTNLLSPPISEIKDSEWITKQQELLNRTLQNFHVGAHVVHVTQGPSVTRFEVQPDPGVKVNKITNLSDDIKLSLAARDIRIEAPIPGKHTIGIEVPNQTSRPVRISEIIQSGVFQTSDSPLTAVLGLDIEGNPIVTDIKKMPHGLIAGATGSGKSVCINSILVSLLYKASPEDLRLLLIDPKVVELAPYNRIPHLVSPVITDVKAATAALKWAVDEMERRYQLFAHTGVRDINRFNELAIKDKRYSDKLPFIVIIIDELADLMMMSPADVEEAICRIAQKARACGIHLLVATQRPSVDVITGLIKANIPTRIAFSVSSQVDSRTIIDISGAEKLLGRGDMLFLENGSSKPVRLQGTFVTDEEIDLVTDHVRHEQEPNYLFKQEDLLKKAQVAEVEDELFLEACEFIIDQGVASTSSLQRRFKIGYNRAARLMDLLEQNGYITGANGSKPREVLITEADLDSILDSSITNNHSYSI